MLWNLSDVFSSEGKVEEAEFDIDMTAFESERGSFPIVEKTPLKLRAVNDGKGRVLLKGHGTFTQRMCCDRCLKEVSVIIEPDISRKLASPDVLSEDDDTDCMDDCQFQVNIETLVYNELLMNQPEKVLCKPDCKGICPVCGRDLNEGECGCDTFVPDPRFAALQDIFDANKEV